MSVQKIPLHLTSTAVTPAEDGNYTYNQMGILIPHEALRREMSRARSALEKFDPVANPWQALYAKIWFKEFFIGMIHEHHDVEEKIVGPEMTKLGVEVPPHLHGAHKELMEGVGKIEKLADELLTVVRAGAEQSLLVEKSDELKHLYIEMHDDMLTHFQAEEEFWVEAILKVPRKEWERIENNIKTVVQKVKSGELFLCSILDSMGYCFKNYSFRPEDTRWCGEDGVKVILGDVPYPVRAFIFPGFNKRYQRYKTIISAIGGDRDVLNLYRTDGTEHAGCACTIV